MGELRDQQMEALSVAGAYCGRLLNAIDNVVSELRGNRLPDTDAYIDEIVNGLNWVLEVTNRTLDLVNESETVIDKEQTNEAVKVLSEALRLKNDELIADSLAGGIRSYLAIFKECCVPYMENN